MKKSIFLVLAVVAIPALADDAALLRCRALRDATARLACYDALPVAVPDAKAPPAPRAAEPRAAEPRAAEPRAVETRPPAPQTPAQFGLEQRPNPVELASIESHIPGNFEGWYPNAVFTLANGQIWQISDGSTRRLYRANPKVKIRRGSFGSFFLEIEGDNNSPRVRRLQ
jgi:hypothetical protein